MEHDIEPPWEGIERSIAAAVTWLILLLGAVPVFCWGTYSLILWLFTGHLFGPGLGYGLGFITGSLPFLRYFDSKGRVFRLVGSNKALILTRDVPHGAAREAADANEERRRASCKLGEGGHVLFPTDQALIEMSIEANIQVPLTDMRIGFGSNSKHDLIVKDGNATFETDPNKLLRLYRIDPDEDERLKLLKSELIPLVKGKITSISRLAGGPDQFLDNYEAIEKTIDAGIVAELITSHYPVRLKKFKLGDTDPSQKEQDARDASAANETIAKSARDSRQVVNEGAEESTWQTPEQSYQNALVVAGIKKASSEDKTIGLAPQTILGFLKILEKIIPLWRNANA